MPPYVPPHMYMRRFRNPELRMTIDGQVRFKWLCTSHQHQENIFAQILAKYDPFVRNGEIVTAKGNGWVNSRVAA